MGLEIGGFAVRKLSIKDFDFLNWNYNMPKDPAKGDVVYRADKEESYIWTGLSWVSLSELEEFSNDE